MLVTCIRDNFGGITWPDDGRRMSYMRGGSYEVHPDAPWAKHFAWAKPEVATKSEATATVESAELEKTQSEEAPITAAKSQSDKMKEYWAKRKADKTAALESKEADPLADATETGEDK